MHVAWPCGQMLDPGDAKSNVLFKKKMWKELNMESKKFRPESQLHVFFLLPKGLSNINLHDRTISISAFPSLLIQYRSVQKSTQIGKKQTKAFLLSPTQWLIMQYSKFSCQWLKDQTGIKLQSNWLEQMEREDHPSHDPSGVITLCCPATHIFKSAFTQLDTFRKLSKNPLR